MDQMSAHGLIDEVGAVRRRARGDRRATSVPLLTFGALTILDAAFRALVDPTGGVALLLLAPLGFVVVALSQRRREIVTGVGGGGRPYGVAALVIVAVVVVFPLTILVGVVAVVGICLLVIAVKQRNLFLGVWAVVYGLVGGLETFFVLSNRLYSVNAALGLFRSQDGYFSWAPSLVDGVLGLALIGAGLYAQRREAAGT